MLCPAELRARAGSAHDSLGAEPGVAPGTCRVPFGAVAYRTGTRLQAEAEALSVSDAAGAGLVREPYREGWAF